MKKHIIELDTTEIVKLIAVCNSAIVTEEETLRYSTGANQKIIDSTKVSIEKIWELKSKLKNVLINSL